MKKKTAARLLPRAPLTTDRRTGGAHQVKRELSAREDLKMRQNELAQEEDDELTDLLRYGPDVSETEDDYDGWDDPLETWRSQR